MTESRNAGYTYMRGRKIEDSTIAKFGIGYADESWDSLYRHFKEKGTDEKLLLELGLISQKGDRYYDKFRSRVMFPIINTSGKVIGFGGRALSSDVEPKYLNSPENKVFQKKNNLYALNLTRQEMGKEGMAIIVEGYMDVIALYQSLSLIHISEPTRQAEISYAVFCLKKKKNEKALINTEEKRIQKHKNSN